MLEILRKMHGIEEIGRGRKYCRKWFRRYAPVKRKGEEKIMYSFLLVIIYMAFISLGLPDSLVEFPPGLWMHTELNNVPVYAGMITHVVRGWQTKLFPAFLF